MKAKYKGFTLIEITLVMVLISILIAITTTLVSNVIARNDVGSAHESLYNSLLRAQQLSKNQYKDSQWRVCLDNINKQYTITSGTCSDPTNAEIIKMSSNITISSTTQTILFKSISGELENTSSITITLTGGGVSKSIIINKMGILSKSPTVEEIAAAMPPLTVTSCTYTDKKISIPYTAGEVGYNYASQTINSTGVTGLTATLLGDGPIATGGDTVTDITVGTDTYRVHTFTTVGTSSLNVIQGGEFEYLVVAGGGGGGMDMGGGGGGGGVLTGNLSLTPQSYNLTVGVGGTGAPSAGTNGQPSGHQYTIPATSGGNSSFASLTAIGGGRGGSSYRGYTPGIAGGNGGSGGGAGGYNDNAGTFLGGTGVTGQGFSGGNSISAYYSGGGGGAGGAGIGSNNQPNGGPGILSNILGTPYYWAGGGGGSGYSGIGGNGGIGGGGGGAVGTTTGGVGINNGSPGGGGGVGSWANTPGGNAGANTGGGGGGGSHYNANNKGGNGGSGIVVVRYKLTGVGTLASSGTLEYVVTGTPSGAGTANFDFSNIGNTGVGCNNSNIAVNVTTGAIATGGDTVTDITVGTDTYRVHTFTTVGTSSLNVINGGEFEYLVVGGGGGGGETIGGGGGGGQVKSGTLSLSSGVTYNTSTGAGGAGGAGSGYPGGVSGSSSSISVTGITTITSLGGGGGGGYNLNGTGSGGGNGGGNGAERGAGVSAGSGQNAGGNSSLNTNSGAGGGGAGSVGSNSTNGNPGAGGAGISSDITGTSLFYAAGGGGGARNPSGGTGASGGSGVGGSGGTGAANGSSGANGTGSGGGGGGFRNSPVFEGAGGNGGSGIVVVRYKLATY